MERNEAIKVLSVIKAAYPHAYKDLTSKDAKAMIDLWTKLFADDTYADVNAAVTALIANRTVGYSPTIGEVKEKMLLMRSPDTLGEQEAWALVSKACRNGYYGYKKEFDKLPDIVQKTVGRAEQLREWALVDSETLQTVIASNFIRSYRTMKERNDEIQKLPAALRQLSGISEQFKLTEGGGQE